MKERDEHFWIEDVASRLPKDLVPADKSWSSVLPAIEQLKAERDNAMMQVSELKEDMATRINQAIHIEGLLKSNLERARKIVDDALG